MKTCSSLHVVIGNTTNTTVQVKQILDLKFSEELPYSEQNLVIFHYPPIF